MSHTFTVKKHFDPTRNNYVGTTLIYNDRSFQHPHSLVGYQNFNNCDWDILYRVCGQPKLIKEKGIGDDSIDFKFEATVEQVQEAGIRFLLDRKKGWATSTNAYDTNPNFELVSVQEAIDVVGSFIEETKVSRVNEILNN